MHSHLGVQSSPLLWAAIDNNSVKGITQPWLRSLDGLNTHDDAFALSISGGVTSANILPGSADAIGEHREIVPAEASQYTIHHLLFGTGGQAFPIKLRPTTERSSSSKLIEQPGAPNTTGWRQIKQVVTPILAVAFCLLVAPFTARHACGENPSR
jgi:hypothetical protein